MISPQRRRGRRIAVALIERWAASTTEQSIDLRTPPLGLSDERFVDTFVALSTTLLAIDPHRHHT